MKENYCKICDYSDLDHNNEWYCDYWNELCKNIEDCDSRIVDETAGW